MARKDYVTVGLPPHVVTAYQKLAEERQTDRAVVMREALIRYIEQPPPGMAGITMKEVLAAIDQALAKHREESHRVTSNRGESPRTKKFSEDPAAIQRARDLRATEPPTSWRELERLLGVPHSTIRAVLMAKKD